MPSSYDRRQFLTHSAATVGGIAMAGTLVDGLLEGVAGATTGVNKGKPKLGGTLTVGLDSDVPNYHTFNGSQGKMDGSGFCTANAMYDPLFVMSKNGQTALPMLALSATPNSNYTSWTIALRHGVSFTNGDPFNAAIVVANYKAAAADPTVGLAIQPIISDVTEVDNYTVKYDLVLPYANFPTVLAEQQIAYMANPVGFASGYTGNPIGTGPFKVKSWTVGVESQFVKNPKYWRKDAAGRKLPYLDQINFKTIPDPNQRNLALQSGSVDMIIQTTGTLIKALGKMKGVSYVTDVDQPRDPEVNSIIMNTTGTLNQYFLWAGEFAGSLGISGVLPTLEAGKTPSAAQIAAVMTGTTGAVNPSTLQWDTSKTPVVNDLSIRKACAMAINRQTYFTVIDAGVGEVMDGIFRKASPYYSNPGYPAYNVAKAKALVNSYKKANNVSSVSFVIDIVASSSAASQEFALIQSMLSKVGITVTSRPSVQSTLINNVIYGEYDAATWSQFGGVTPSLNYVWWLSLPASQSLAKGGLGMPNVSGNVAGAVNFAHQNDPAVESALINGIATKPGSSTNIASWRTVNSRFAEDIPYLWLDATVNAWAARSNVQNWVSGTAGDGHTPCLSPDGPVARWDQIWVS